MKLIIDSANIEKIKDLYQYYPISGVTTNPSILKRNGQDPYNTIKSIKEIVENGQLHVQVISKQSDDIVKEAKHICDVFGKETYIKIPAVKQGYKAMKELSSLGYKITATAIYEPTQAYMAAMCGASYVAPYVNRVEKLYGDGVDMVKEIINIFKNNNLNCEILGASFKRKDQIQSMMNLGIDACTIDPDLFETLVQNKNVDEAVDAFREDFEELVGQGKTMLYK